MTYSEALYKIETGRVWINKKTGGWYEVLGVAQQSAGGCAARLE